MKYILGIMAVTLFVGSANAECFVKSQLNQKPSEKSYYFAGEFENGTAICDNVKDATALLNFLELEDKGRKD